MNFGCLCWSGAGSCVWLKPERERHQHKRNQSLATQVPVVQVLGLLYLKGILSVKSLSGFCFTYLVRRKNSQ